ncbi:SDR family NAD(P)-dependent oxidoreductase [Amycolatopsis echigonensis]|uniref:3-oxoacyl-[acyl-carrier protein] reductase n=1 Tax=Amycolatopsis echigonensis TaxID=2576905 RepID=A0A2N3WN71_9PSEU|nr:MULTISPECIES: SDR family NAD(P)-dependent oxidoreductase [Amycolatopsis]PKV95309.1 3-oxoacyl-[acyl-carrier protein] reductase [Amycolatopsis niigatensis]
MTPGVLDPRGPASLAGQRAVVTGAARGIGSRVAVELALAGAHVTALDRHDPAGTVAEITELGGSAAGLQADITDREAIATAMAEAAGPPRRLDALVTCAAVYGETVALDELSESEVDLVLGVNIKGTLWCINGALPFLRGHDSRVVCIGSVAGKVGGVLAGPHYVASKGAVHAVVKWLAKTEAGNGILANAVAPGVVDTEMIRGKGYSDDYNPLGRLARPEEIARVAAFLASPAASYMTGAVVDVNGGYAMG